MSTGPLNPGAGVKEYVPFAFSVKVPCAVVGPVTRLAVRVAPVPFRSLLRTFPVTLAEPSGLARTIAKSSTAPVFTTRPAGSTVK